MADRFTAKQRSWNMSRIRSRDTKPEKAVRSLLHREGFRFKLRGRKLSGNPDIVLPKYRAVVFVHGCFWHRHKGCKRAYLPATHRDYWLPKLRANVRRDQAVQRELRMSGWRCLVVWECDVLKDTARCVCRLSRLLRQRRARGGCSRTRTAKRRSS